MDNLLVIVLVVLAAALGLAAGWIARGRGMAALRAERDERLQQFRDALKDVDIEKRRSERIPELERALADTLESREQARAEAAALKAAREERERAFKDQLAQLKEQGDALKAEFGQLAANALEAAQRNFLERADQRFNQAGEKSGAQLKALLQPVEATLKRYEEGLAQVEKDRISSYGELREAVSQLAQGNEVVRREAARLANVMRSSPKARGRWGEEQLRTILESAGLAENVDFALQSSVNDGERQLRPDCVIQLPGDRCIVIDVKCPLVHFEQAFDEEDEEKRANLLLQHASAMKAYANDLGRKGYWKQFDLSPDFVIMFIPGEHFLSAAAERAPDLIEVAFRNGVIVASTINMLALAKVMAGMWRQEKLAEEAQKIGDLGKKLYARLATMGNHVAKLGRNLNLAAGAYNDFIGSLETQVMTQARRFEELKIDTGGKSIELLPTVDVALRPLVKLSEEGELAARGN